MQVGPAKLIFGSCRPAGCLGTVHTVSDRFKGPLTTPQPRSRRLARLSSRLSQCGHRPTSW